MTQINQQIVDRFLEAIEYGKKNPNLKLIELRERAKVSGSYWRRLERQTGVSFGPPQIRKSNRFPSYQKKYIKTFIKDLYLEDPNIKTKTIAEKLNNEKIKHPNTEQWSAKNVVAFQYQYMKGRRTRMIKRSIPVLPMPKITKITENLSDSKSKDVLSLAEMILASNLDENVKEQVLRGLFK